IIYFADKRIIDAMVSAHGLLADKQIMSILMDNMVRMMPGMAGVDISTREGLYQAVLAVSIASGCLVGGAHVAMGFAQLVPAIYNLIKGVASRSDFNLIQKACGIAKPVLKAFSDQIESVMERAMSAWYTRDAIEMLRETGHLIGETMAGLYVGGRILGLIRGAGSFVKIKAGDVIDGPIGKIVEMGGKTADRIRGAAAEAAERILGEEISGSLGRGFEALLGKGGELNSKIRLFLERRMGWAFKEQDRGALGTVTKGNAGFGKGIQAEGKATGTQRAATGTIGTGLYIMGKALEFIAKRIRGAYISKQGAEALTRVTEKARSIIGGAGKTDRTREKVWSGTGFRQRRLVDGLIPPQGPYQITGDLPLEKMGLSFLIPKENGLSYSADSLGIKLEGSSLFINDNKPLNINGLNYLGVTLTSENNSSISLLNGSVIELTGNTFSIKRGTALSGNGNVINIIPFVPENIIRSELPKEGILDKCFIPAPGFMLINQGGLSTGVNLGLECGYDAFTYLKEGALSLKESADPFLNPVDTGVKIGQKLPELILEGFKKIYTMARRSWLEKSVDMEGQKVDFWMDIDSSLAYWSDVGNYFAEEMSGDIEYASGFWKMEAIDAKDWLVDQAIYWGDVGKNFIDEVKDDIIYAGDFWFE
ncbi:MAG: hypothetical protein WBC00_02425, partial [Candidatus Omnitrophota bacterium]